MKKKDKVPVRRVGDLLKDLGFNKEAPLETQQAFLRHLVRAANSSKPSPLTHSASPQKIESKSDTDFTQQTQLSFDSDILGFASAEPLRRKVPSRR